MAGCCGRRSTKISYSSTQAPATVVEDDGTLSAARLTPQGWVRTCVKCGKVSDPEPFVENIHKTCDCSIGGNVDA